MAMASSADGGGIDCFPESVTYAAKSIHHLNHTLGAQYQDTHSSAFVGGLPRDTEIRKEYEVQKEIHWKYHRNIFILILHLNLSVAIPLLVSAVQGRAPTSLPPSSHPRWNAPAWMSRALPRAGALAPRR